MTLLNSHSDCRKCQLHSVGKSVGIATRLADACDGTKSKAVLLLGKAPGLEEDEQGRAFVGPSGIFTNSLYVRGVGLEEVADVYLGNVVRCRLPVAKMAIPSKSATACQQWLLDDLDTLRTKYQEVVLLVTGSDAIQAIVGESINFSKFVQGARIKVGDYYYPCFATYIAAMLLPKNDPSKSAAVRDHLLMLREYLEYGDLSTEFNEVAVDRLSRIPADTKLVSLDIETYGCVESYPRQRFFHPQKSIDLDQVPSGQLVLTAAAAWRQPDGTLANRFYDLTDDQDNSEFHADMLGLEAGVSILGQNIQFDVMYLRAWSPVLRTALTPFGKYRLVDLAVLNFLDSDVRPERSLKSLSPLLRITNYEHELSLKAGERYPSASDSRLAAYNVKDAVATLRGYEVLTKRLRLCYGENTPKGSPECLEFYSDLLWLLTKMSTVGVPHDQAVVESVHRRLTRRLARMTKWAQRRGWLLSGKGSAGFKSAFALRCANELGLAADRRLNVTEITKQVSFNEANIRLFLGAAKSGTELRAVLRFVRKFTTLRDIVSRYTTPMLGLDERRLSCKLLHADQVSVAYPTWYVVPTASDLASDSGGTQQGRVTAKTPAVQTSPPAIEAAECTHVPGWFRVSIDEAQIEYRVPAMFSGDDAMKRDFQEGVNRHAATAAILAGRPVDKHQDAQLYHFGKTANFLIGFRGGAAKLQETYLEQTGCFIELPVLEKFIREFYRRHLKYRQWQDGLIHVAKTTGRIELPVLGLHRSFLGSPDIVDKTYVPTICNFPVQATAALFTLSAQIAAEKWLLATGRQSYIYKNTYDEGVYAVHPAELVDFLDQVPTFYREPPLLKRFAETVPGFDASVPLDCSIKIVYNGGPRVGPSNIPLMESLMQIKPLGNNIICLTIKNEEKSKGGVLLPDQAVGVSIWSKVVAAGPEVSRVSVGQTVLLSGFSGQEFEIEDGDEKIRVLVAKDTDVLATR